MARSEKITPAEWLVMDALWDLEEAAAGDIITRLENQTGWNHRTIRTLLRRLVDKGLVNCSGAQQRPVYRPAVNREACIRSEGKSFLDRVFRGDASSLLLHFAREAGLSRTKVQQLRKLLDEESQT